MCVLSELLQELQNGITTVRDTNDSRQRDGREGPEMKTSQNKVGLVFVAGKGNRLIENDDDNRDRFDTTRFALDSSISRHVLVGSHFLAVLG